MTMAIDKSRTSVGTKVVIIIIVAAFVLLGLATAISSFTGGGGTTSATSTDTVQTQLATINQNAQPPIQADELRLKSKPNDYALLKQLGDEYYDWAQRVKQAAPNAGVDLPIWARGAQYYGKALEVKPGDPSVQTDMAIAQYYSNDTTAAIVTIQAVMKKDPKFAPAPFNAGIFYAGVGDAVKATEAFNTYLKIEPTGQNADTAKKFLAEIKTATTSQPPAASGNATGK
jgi:hypothetical protein